MIKAVLWIISVFALLCLSCLLALSNYLVSFAISRGTDPGNVSPPTGLSMEAVRKRDENRVRIQKKRKAWLETAQEEKVSLSLKDGIVLAGSVFKSPLSGHEWVILVHGYRCSRQDTYDLASFFAEEGYNILAVDLRAHGESTGKYAGMGWLDRKDLALWVQYLVARDKIARIILHGTSMGAAAVLMAAGDKPCGNVRGVVADCGYTSVWDIFSDEMAVLFGLHPFPLLYIADRIAKVRAGYGFREASVILKLRDCRVPVLFIHGSADTFVRTSMAYALYEACPSEKKLLIIEGAGHAESYLLEPERYFKTIFLFCKESLLEIKGRPEDKGKISGGIK